jgi:hypothetical protein
MRDGIRLVLIMLIATAVGSPLDGARSRALTAAAPALELKKVISFPLSGDALPGSGDALADAIEAGLRGRVTLAEGSTPVHIQGAGAVYPALHQLTIDLTDASIRSDHPLPKLKPRGPIESTVSAQGFQFIADPMKVDGADIHLNITASNVSLGMQHDIRTGQPILIFADARDGEVHCDTTMNDLSQIFRASADFRGKPYGLRVGRAKLALVSHSEHQLTADLRLGSRLLLVPIGLHFTAHVDVDDAGDAHLSNLTCDGDDIAGWLISGFIRPSLARYNSRTMPLIAFPTDKIKLHNLRVKIEGDNIHVAAAFGN